MITFKIKGGKPYISSNNKYCECRIDRETGHIDINRESDVKCDGKAYTLREIYAKCKNLDSISKPEKSDKKDNTASKEKEIVDVKADNKDDATKAVVKKPRKKKIATE